eukprot:62279_1
MSVNNITLFLLDFSPEIGARNFRFTEFGLENGTVIFKPCNEELFNPKSFPSTSFTDFSMKLNETHKHIEAGALFQDSLKCNKSVCFASCINPLSCFGGTFDLIASNMSLIYCNGDTSCHSSIITISSSAYGSILCTEPSSCQQSTINITNVNQFELECVNENSCSELSISIWNSPATIKCYEHNACKFINVKSDRNDLILYFYNFNQNVDVTLPSEFYQNNLHCNPNNAYLSLSNSNSGKSFEELIYSLYASPPPCSGTTYNFEDNNKISCDIKYTYYSYNVDI